MADVLKDISSVLKGFKKRQRNLYLEIRGMLKENQEMEEKIQRL